MWNIYREVSIVFIITGIVAAVAFIVIETFSLSAFDVAGMAIAAFMLSEIIRRVADLVMHDQNG